VSFDHLVRRQAGVVTLRHAVACGLSAATVQRRARQKAWERLHPAVYLVGGRRLTDEARVRAAWVWAGDVDAERFVTTAASRTPWCGRDGMR
jgi:hypothetical protein